MRFLVRTAVCAVGLLNSFFCRAQLAHSGAEEPLSLLPISPDSVTRNLYRRTRVRAVIKVRLNAEGLMRDTVSCQELDTAGRFLRLDEYLPPQAHQQWSYDAQGRCISLVVHPTPGKPDAYIFAYNPALGRSSHQVLKSDGRLLTISETTLLKRADTLLTETHTLRALTGAAVQGAAIYQRVVRYAPHPDTVLLLQSQYTQSRQLLTTTAVYQLSRQGHPYERGELNIAKIARLQKVNASGKSTGNPVSYLQLVRALRRSQGLVPQQWWHYDTRNRVVQHINRRRLDQTTQFSDITTNYVYNNEDQLIGRAHSVTAAHRPTRAAYAVFSYSPIGLLLGETSDIHSTKPVFYRYLYQYYE